MKRLARSTSIAFIAMLMLTAMPASAGLRWCYSDPIFEVNGTRVQVVVGIPVEDQPAVKGNVRVTIVTPANVDYKFIEKTPGFNGWGQDVEWSPTLTDDDSVDKFKMRVYVTIPIDSTKLSDGRKTIPVKVETTIAGKGTRISTGTSEKVQVVVEVESTVIEDVNETVDEVVGDSGETIDGVVDGAGGIVNGEVNGLPTSDASLTQQR